MSRQALSRSSYPRNESGLFGAFVPQLERFQRVQDGLQWRAQLVADFRKELALRTQRVLRGGHPCSSDDQSLCTGLDANDREEQVKTNDQRCEILQRRKQLLG